MNNSPGDTIFIETKFAATAEKLWSAWTNEDMVMQWFGSDPNGKVLHASLDVQSGGSFEVTFRNSNGTEHTCSGVYKEVQPYKKLSFTWMWKSEPGVESFITILLAPNGNDILMLFEHVNVGYASAHNYVEGWQDTFRKLEK